MLLNTNNNDPGFYNKFLNRERDAEFGKVFEQKTWHTQEQTL